MPVLDQVVAKAKKSVRKEFPELAGVEPTVSTREAHAKGAGGARTVYVLTFKKSIAAQDGKGLMRVVRVTMDQTGAIIKLTSSR